MSELHYDRIILSSISSSSLILNAYYSKKITFLRFFFFIRGEKVKFTIDFYRPK